MQLWVEKYRPQSFDEVIGQDKIVEKLKAMVEQKNIPHLMFAGPPGVGKTTLALIIAKSLFKDNLEQNFLELNASDERGIDTVRNIIKDFARTKAIGTDLPKIIFLDECDSLTKEAQQALRRTMERFTGTARFILSCNYSSKLIEPIQSRCTIFRFKSLSKDDLVRLLNDIAKREQIIIQEGALNLLCEISHGDCRRAENILQSCVTVTNDVSEDAILELISYAKPQDIKDMLNLALGSDFIRARTMLLDTMLTGGVAGVDIIKQIQKELWELNIPQEKKLKLIEKCAETEFRMVEGSDEFVQLEALLAEFLVC